MRDDFSAETRDILARVPCPRSPWACVGMCLAARTKPNGRGGNRAQHPALRQEARVPCPRSPWACVGMCLAARTKPQRRRSESRWRFRALTRLLGFCMPTQAWAWHPLTRLLGFCMPTQAWAWHPAFDKAIEDTITALNTGCLRSRDGAVLQRAKGKAFLRKLKWRQQMDAIVDLLRAIRARYKLAKKGGQIHVHANPDGREFYCIHDPAIAEWMDSTRRQILEMFSETCSDAGLPPIPFPRHFPRRW